MSFSSRGCTRYQTGTVPLCSTSGSRSTIDLTSTAASHSSELAPTNRTLVVKAQGPSRGWSGVRPFSYIAAMLSRLAVVRLHSPSCVAPATPVSVVFLPHVRRPTPSGGTDDLRGVAVEAGDPRSRLLDLPPQVHQSERTGSRTGAS